MPFPKTTFMLICLSLLLLSCSTNQDISTNNEEVDALFSEWDKSDSPGYGLGVIQDGKLVYAKGYGEADLEHDIPITPSSVFYIGSVSKQFVTMCILLLEEEGKINLDDEIQVYLPDFPRYDSPLTIRNFIHHTSGVKDNLTLWGLAGNDILDHIEDEAIYEMIKRQKELNFTPGERYLYSNSCYFMLAMVVEEASGESLKEYADKNIFSPLGMSNSHFHDDHSHLIKDKAFSYSPSNGYFKNLIMRFDLVGSGGVYSNIKDMYLWDQNFNHNILGKGGQELIEKMHTNGLLNNGESTGYAFAIANGTYRGLRTSGHSGALAGYRANHMRFPDQDFSVILLGNLSSHNSTLMAKKVAEVYLEDQMEPVEDINVTTNSSNSNNATPYEVTNPEQYKGSYYSEELDVNYTISFEYGRLYCRVKHNPSMAMTGNSKDIFRFQGVRVAFSRVNNRITGFRLDAGRVQNLNFIKK
jgi:CubicO group peptidase (beta-lactamase class C family)